MQHEQGVSLSAADQMYLGAAQFDKFFAKFPHVSSLFH